MINAGAASSATAGTTVDQPVTHNYCSVDDADILAFSGKLSD